MPVCDQMYKVDGEITPDTAYSGLRISAGHEADPG
jgi:hypothetical protein